LLNLLAWMAEQDFETIAGGEPSLLRQVEAIVVDSHRRLYAAEGREWSKPVAYRWLRYEDPMPVERLAEGVEKLDRLGATFEADAVEKAVAEAFRRGFSN
jgi:hypothetical protein